MLEGDSPEVIIKTGNTTTEEVTNADLFSLLKTYMNDKLSGIEKNLNDTKFCSKVQKVWQVQASHHFNRRVIGRFKKTQQINTHSGQDEYLSDEVANDSEDAKRIRTAENRAVKMIKTHKKDTGKQNRKRPAEAAGSFTQVAHDGGNAVNYNATHPFRATGTGAYAPNNSKANDHFW